MLLVIPATVGAFPGGKNRHASKNERQSAPGASAYDRGTAVSEQYSRRGGHAGYGDQRITDAPDPPPTVDPPDEAASP
ncbi:MAG: hypothetical protein WAP37_00265, partial [Solirubrobacterales bacterium]